MKKKGFTLIELLAVMVIIGILLTLTVSAVSRYMNKGKRTYYLGLESNIKTSGQEYMSDYKSLLPREIGNTSVITLEELVSNKYIDNVVDEDKNTCSGSVTVEKTAKQKYEYYVCLQCGDNYTSDKENCEKIGTNKENKNYLIELNGGSTTVVNQCDEFSLPTASVYRVVDGEKTLVTDSLLPSPKSVDTTILGETTVKWMYRYKSLGKVVRVQDKVSPTKPVIQLTTISGTTYNGKNEDGTLNITNQDINIMVTSKDYACIDKHPTLEGSGLDSIQYKVEGTDKWNKISTNKTTTKTKLNKTLYGKVKLKTVDKYSNSSEISTFEIYMDKSKPSKTIVTYLGGSNTHKYQNNYKLQLESTDDIGVAYFEIDWNNDGIADTTTSSTFIPWDEFDKCNTRFRAVDIAGNKGEWSDENHIHMDTTAPEKTVVNLNGYTDGSWTNKNVTQTYTSSDSLSGVDYYEYSYNKTKIEGTTKDSWEMKTDGKHILYARAVDKAGNRGIWSEAYSINRDTVSPTCTLKVSNNPNKVGEWYVSDVNIDFDTKSDDLSGIGTFNIDVNNITTNTNADGQVITGTITDNASNSSTCTINVKADINSPVISAKSNPIGLGTQDYTFTSNVNVTFGPLGGTTTCDPAASKKTGTYDVVCTASGNNGKSSTVTFKAGHSYSATPIYHTHSSSCYGTKKCGHWDFVSGPGACGGCNNTFKCNGCGQQKTIWSVADSNGSGWGAGDHYVEYIACGKSTSTVVGYSCPNGGTLSGATCYFN